jgi:hypothetical protein
MHGEMPMPCESRSSAPLAAWYIQVDERGFPMNIYANTVLAGMPSLSLTDIAALRMQSISFFLLVLLLCAWGVMALWNALRKDFPKLPVMSYGRALAVMTLWGLVFVIVLTMISGARELLTPGAWQKDGMTYKLKGGGK